MVFESTPLHISNLTGKPSCTDIRAIVGVTLYWQGFQKIGSWSSRVYRFDMGAISFLISPISAPPNFRPMEITITIGNKKLYVILMS